MQRVLILLLASLGILSPPASAQGNQARATLYTRSSGDDVYAAVVIRISADWYLYHTDLGDPDAIGTPLSLRFGDDGSGWSDPVLPQPKVEEVDDPYLGKYSFNYHDGKITLYAKGKISEGASADDTLTLDGQTCSHVSGTCLRYGETIRSKGEGKDKYWQGWPASLGPPPPAAGGGGDEQMPGGSSAEESSSQVTANPGKGVPTQPGAGSGALARQEFGGFGGFGRAPAGPKVVAKLYSRIDEESNTAKLAVVIDIAEGYHIYNGPTAADLGHPDFTAGVPTTLEVVDDSGSIEWGEVRYPKPIKVDGGSLAPWYWQHRGRVVLRVDGQIVDDPEGAEPYAILGYQVCDEKTCDPPAEEELYSEGPGEDEWFETPTFTAGELSTDDQDRSSLLLFLLSAVGWGIFTLLMPCTYPMIPITISFFTKQAEARDGKVLPLSLAYGLGIVLVFILIGVLFAPVIIPFATHWVTNMVIGVLFLLFSLALFGFVHLEPPAALMNMAGKASRVGGYLGVFLMGATLVVTSFTCTAPFVGTLLGAAAAGGKGDLMRIVLGMGTFGVTMATPFVFLSLVPGRVRQMPQAGEWMNTLKVFLGFVELAASLKFFSNVDLVLGWGVIGREVFLAAWLVIFIAAGLYLIIKARRTHAAGGPSGSRQIGFGMLSILFGLYCGYGIPGNMLDGYVMTPLLPPYAIRWDPNAAQHEIVKDDYEEALARAKEKSKLVLVNFTGLT